MTSDSFYDDIELTPEEVKAALLEGRKRKYFKLKADLKEQEDGMHPLREPQNRKSGSDVVRIVQQATPDSGQGEGSTGTQTDSKGKPGKNKGATAIREAQTKVS